MADNAPVKKDTTDHTSVLERTSAGTTYTPRVDIFEHDEELTLYVDMPGVKSEDIDIRFEKDHLEIFGKCPPRHEGASFLFRE